MKPIRTALFVAYGGGHISMVLPVIEALRSRAPEVKCVLLALTTGFQKAVTANASPLGYKDFLHLADAQAVRYWGQRLRGSNTSPDVSEDESIAYLGINYLDLIEQYGEVGAAAAYAKNGRYGFEPLHFMRRLLAEIQPEVVVATNSPRSERAALDVAIEQGVASVGMVDLFGQEGDTYVSRNPKPDWTCVISSPVKQRLVDRGFAPHDVVVTGSPAFDGLFSPANRAAAYEFLAALQWQGLLPILWTGQMDPVMDRTPESQDAYRFPIDVETVLRGMVVARKDVALIVRYHPSQWHTFPRLPDQERVHFSVPSQEHIHPLILAAKVVVVQNSTVGLESAVAGKPVVSLEHSPAVRNSHSLAAMGISIPCNATHALPALLDNVLSRSTAVPTEYASDGRAAERVADVVITAIARKLKDAQ